MEEKIISVTNRAPGSVGYTLPDSNLHRTFEFKETKKVPLSELQQVSYLDGGEYILKNYLIVNDMSALEALNLEVEPEYFYTDAEIKTLLTTGSLDELEDCLNFAPDGVIELIKKIAVETEIPDTRKRKMISEKTGLNIDNAIQVNHIMNEEDENAETETKTRKATPMKAGASATQRKTAAPKYKVVNEG